jgi:hypothetical protein
MVVNLWHDDVRRPPNADWIWARTNDEAKETLTDYEVDVISMDHDLGGHDLDPDAPETWLHRGPSSDGTGLDLVDWMIQNECVPRTVYIHSWNGPGAMHMIQTLISARQQGLIPESTYIVRRPYERP